MKIVTRLGLSPWVFQLFRTGCYPCPYLIFNFDFRYPAPTDRPFHPLQTRSSLHLYRVRWHAPIPLVVIG